MELTHVLMRRIAWASLTCFVFALLLAGWRARFDVHREGEGAEQTARLMGMLAALQTLPADHLASQLNELKKIAGEGGLRHLQLRLEDGQGSVLIGPAPFRGGAGYGTLAWLLGAGDQDGAAGSLQAATEATSWLLQREDGRQFRVTLMASSQSEQNEAAGNILGMSGLLLLQSVTLLFAMYLTVRHVFAPLRNILGAIAAFEQQDYGTRLPAMGIRELDVIARSLNGLAEALTRGQEERRFLSLKVLTLQEDERARISRELHDEFGQTLTAMRADAAYLARRTGSSPELCDVARGIEQQCGAVQQSVRDLLRQLRAPDGGAEGEAVQLRDLIRTLVDSWQKRPGQGTRYQLQLGMADESMPQPLALGLYRMTQEALTNVARHAGAREVVVSLEGRPGEGLHWSVCDDGAGIPSLEQAIQQGNGLAGIRERAWALGGELEILERKPPGGAGLCLAARLPWPKS